MHSIPALHVCDIVAGLPDCHAESQCSHIYFPTAMCPTVLSVQDVDMGLPVCRCCSGEDLSLFTLEGCHLLLWLAMPKVAQHEMSHRIFADRMLQSLAPHDEVFK